MSNNTREAVIDCLVEFTERQVRPAFTDTSWIEDFGLDSLRLFHSLLHLEKRLGFTFAEDELNLANVEDFRNLVEMVHRRRYEEAPISAQ